MAAIVNCKSCGKPIAGGDRFCGACGTAIDLGAETVVAAPTHHSETGATQCLKCGTSIGKDDRFCPQCGTSRPEPATVVSHVSLRNAQAVKLIEATKGEFEILEQLGTGAMGAVYLAKDIALGRNVAIKVIAPHLLSDATMISRFRQEAQTVASLRHPNIVNVHAVRQSSEMHYFVMEFIDGPPLRNIVKSHAPLDVDITQSILFQVGSALSHAHRAGKGGVIHRDVKPANIMIDHEGDAFVTDFGISKIQEVQTGLTQTGATIGTPEYMSPEQCRGDALSGASDQYALGIVAYEMLCGHTPFTGNQYHIMVAHTSERPKPILDERPDCPPHVAEAVERMLAKTPAERWPDLDSAVMAMGGAPLGYHDPVRRKIKSLIGATVTHIPTVGGGSRAGTRGSLETATSVTVSGLPSVLETGERIPLRADVRGTANASLSGLGVVWASTDPSIARVDGGFVEGLRPGSVSIMASAGNVATSVLLTVTEPVPSSVLVRPSSIRMQKGGRFALTAQVQDKRGRPLQREVRWRSSEPRIATVSPKGEVVAKEGGSVTIAAQCESASGSTEIVVEAPAGASVPTAAPGGRPSGPVPVGSEDEAAPPRAKPAPRARPASQEAAPKRSFARPVVLVPVALLVAAGVALPFLGGGEPQAAEVRVTLAGSGEPVEGGVSVALGSTLALSAVAADQAGNVVDEPVSWASADESIVAVSSEGVLTPVSRGTTSVTAAAASVSRPIPVTVSVAVASVAIVDGSGAALASLDLGVGDRAALAARVVGEDGSPVEEAVAWRSQDPAIVSVDERGALRAVAPGLSTVEAAAGGVTRTLAVNVRAPVTASAAPAPAAARPTTAPAATQQTSPPTTQPVASAPAQQPPRPAAAQPVLLEISVGPQFATLFVDGVQAGEGRRLYSLQLQPGEHTIRLENPRFQPHTEVVRIEAGQPTQQLRVQLRN